MTLAADLANDYQFVDGTETVSVTDTSAGTTFLESISALRGRQLMSESGGSPAAGPEIIDVEWTLYAATMNFTPAPGDVITDSSIVKWTIASVQTVRILNTAYKHICVTRKQ